MYSKWCYLAPQDPLHPPEQDHGSLVGATSSVACWVFIPQEPSHDLPSFLHQQSALSLLHSHAPPSLLHPQSTPQSQVATTDSVDGTASDDPDTYKPIPRIDTAATNTRDRLVISDCISVCISILIKNKNNFMKQHVLAYLMMILV